MAIINLGTMADKGKSGFEVGTVKAGRELITYTNGTREVIGEAQGPFVDYCTYLTHEGFCLRDFERNGYDDSDFCMIVWNAEKHEPETVTFASTRGWSYPCYGSWADATDEVKADYANYLDAQERLHQISKFKADVERLCRLRNICRQLANQYGFQHARMTRLRKVMNLTDLGALVNLLENTRIRSEFKLKLRAQVLAWLRDPNPKYATPLSRKQMDYV